MKAFRPRSAFLKLPSLVDVRTLLRQELALAVSVLAQEIDGQPLHESAQIKKIAQILSRHALQPIVEERSTKRGLPISLERLLELFDASGIQPPINRGGVSDELFPTPRTFEGWMGTPAELRNAMLSKMSKLTTQQRKEIPLPSMIGKVLHSVIYEQCRVSWRIKLRRTMGGRMVYITPANCRPPDGNDGI